MVHNKLQHKLTLKASIVQILPIWASFLCALSRWIVVGPATAAEAASLLPLHYAFAIAQVLGYSRQTATELFWIRWIPRARTVLRLLQCKNAWEDHLIKCIMLSKKKIHGNSSLLLNNCYLPVFSSLLSAASHSYTLHMHTCIYICARTSKCI